MCIEGETKGKFLAAQMPQNFAISQKGTLANYFANSNNDIVWCALTVVRCAAVIQDARCIVLVGGFRVGKRGHGGRILLMPSSQSNKTGTYISNNFL